ncbi:MAG: lipopolysaccharide heptosyltransferase II [Desulfomonilaceae bacterium]|nr:lipopolysaccharide heptosyltransferase II [Desulfomonilaceae bacterium]
MNVDFDRPAVPSRIVVRGTNWVGDTVISLPAAKELKRIFPRAHFTFWIPRGLCSLVSATALADEVIWFDGNSGGALHRPFRMRNSLAKGGFDMAILLQNAFESAFTSWLARIPVRAGYPTDLRGPLLNLRVPLREDVRSTHQVFYYLGITDFLGNHFGTSRPADTPIPDCSIEISEQRLSQAAELLTHVGADLGRSVFSLCPGSVNSEAKRWPGEYFARLGDLLIREMGAQVVFLGAPEETGLIEGIISMMHVPGAVSLAGKADIVASMAVMNQSRMVISNDTGSAHLAVAASSTVLTVFGPTSAGATAPYGPTAHIIQGNAPCAPCRRFRCPVSGHPCMRSIEPEAVLSRVEEILARH